MPKQSMPNASATFFPGESKLSGSALFRQLPSLVLYKQLQRQGRV
jgi:hypothetical protein